MGLLGGSWRVQAPTAAQRPDKGDEMGLLDRLFGGGKKDSGPTFTYKVGVSDTCRSVAKRFFGDESQWEKVYKPNEWRLKEEVQSGTDRLLPGTELTIKGAKFGLDGQPYLPTASIVVRCDS
ncbi:MAG: hypothetical protein EBT47_13855 [Chloroflexi bacterium]|nr:hypothetical protein [Chloroflexota bacterium]